MQQEGCEEIQLLISRFVDDEVLAHERKQVEEHVGTCDECAYKLLEYMEMAVLLTETPLRQPDPQLRSSLFREIGTMKEEAKLKEDAEQLSRERPWPAPTATARDGKRVAPSFLGKLMQVASPLSMAAAALFVFLGALLLGNRLTTSAPPTPEVQEIRSLYILPNSGSARAGGFQRGECATAGRHQGGHRERISSCVFKLLCERHRHARTRHAHQADAADACAGGRRRER